MSEAKIEIKIGEIQFSSQGEQEWVAQQLDKILAQAEKLIELAPPTPPTPQEGIEHKPMGKDPAISKKTLPSFLSEKDATKNQVRKFLATAVWLEAKGKSRLVTSDVTGALTASNQSRLGNAAQCLNENVGKGYCEKVGKEFYVTEEGKASLEK